MRKATWYVMAFLSLCIGLYPLIYTWVNRHFGLLSTKPDALFQHKAWQAAFYIHILFGGLALLVGWAQFHAGWRVRYPAAHRRIGYIYLFSVGSSGLAGTYIAQYATGGIVSQIGFTTLALIWLGSSGLAYAAVRRGNLRRHEQAMYFSFAACFAAVTLRLELPLLVWYFDGQFVPAYRIVAWLCWAPNILVAWWYGAKHLSFDP